jgi:serine/threonine protein kinase/Flp pilus assembly protein TadD
MGRWVRHYELLDKLGEGGMGVVYKARDTHLDRFVVLKMLRAEKLADPERKSRFIREAKAASSLNHPNIITIHDIAHEMGVDFIVMEFVSGKTLDKVIPSKGLAVKQCLRYAVQVADALIGAHGAGIIHRDLKPGNIMVDDFDRVRVLDFGVAKLMHPAGEGSELTAAASAVLTEEGAIVGTVAYMSPEQAEGRKVDARSDIFSFGLIVYEMLSGRHAFGKTSKISTLAAILHEDPPPVRELVGDVPPELEKIITQCLQKDPARRFQHAADLKLALEELQTGETREEARRARAAPSIAVLPFENLSADKENEYFSDGLTEEIINALAKVPGFRVVGRTSSFTFRGRQFGIREIGEKLRVETLLEGSVRKAGNRLRITAQMVNASDGYQIWSERYDRTMEDVFEIQDEISHAIVEALKAKLGSGAAEAVEEWQAKRVAPRPAGVAAHEAYLKGRYYWNQRTWDSLRKGIEFFTQAIEKDPLHSQAYVGLADCYNLFGYYNERLPRDTYPKAKAAALQALEIDPDLAEAHATLGYATLFYDWDWVQSERSFKRAIELNPAYASAHQWYGWYFFATHRLEEAVETMRRAHALDPLAPIINSHLGLALATAGRFDEATDQIEQSIEMHPAFAQHYLVLGSVCLKQGKNDSAIELFRKAVELSQSRMPLGWLGHAYAVLGQEAEARSVVTRLSELAKEESVSPLCFALVHAGLGDNDQAFDWLEKAYEQRTSDLIRLRLYPWPEAFTADPRLPDLIRRIGLPARS